MSTESKMGRLAVVTGGGSGIGLAAATSLVNAGFSVLLVGRRQNKLDAAARLIGPSAATVAADMSSEADIQRVVDVVRNSATPLHALVNNAGANPQQHVVDDLHRASQAFDQIIGVNLKAAYLLISALQNHFVTPGGRVVNVTSIGPYTGSGGPAYAASKSGMHGMTAALAKELGPSGITVNAIAPGFVHTDMTASVTPEHLVDVYASIPLRRAGEAREIGDVIAFLCSPAASYVTGQILPVCGGKTLGR